MNSFALCSLFPSFGIQMWGGGAAAGGGGGAGAGGGSAGGPVEGSN